MPTYGSNQVPIDPQFMDADLGALQNRAGDSGFMGRFLKEKFVAIANALKSVLSVATLAAVNYQPGDIKLSLRQYDRTGDINQMPGFVPWIPDLELRKADYPNLYAAIGSASTQDEPTVETFKLPAHNNGYIRLASEDEGTGNRLQEFATGASTPVDGIRIFAWIKT